MGNLLGHEGKGSLLSFLRKKLWADELYAGTNGTSSSQLISLFSVNIRLTEDGFNHMDEVLEAIFSYLKLLQLAGPNERIFNELQNMRANRFRFAQEQNAFDNVQMLVANVKQYPTDYALTGPKLFFEFNSDVIRKFIAQLNEWNINIMITSMQPYNEHVTFEMVEPWYGTKYTELDMPTKWFELWQNTKPFPEFQLPEPNPFVADDFTIGYETGTTTITKYPTKILDNVLCELWFRPDDTFLLPTANYKFHFISPQIIASTKK